jgi:hypothetical protein
MRQSSRPLVLVVAAALIVGCGSARGDEGDASASRDCALAWNRTAGEEERSLLNKDAQVARGSEQERRVRVLVTAHGGDDERFTRLDGGQGVARPGACMVIGQLGMTFVQRRPSAGWQSTQAQSFGPLNSYVRRVLSGESNAYVEAPIAGLEDPTPRDGLILGVDHATLR